MPNYIIYILLFVFVAFVINRLYVAADSQRKRRKTFQRNFTDQEIIQAMDDPLTGEKYVVSAINEVDRDDFDPNEVIDELDELDEIESFETNKKVHEKFIRNNLEKDSPEYNYAIYINYLLEHGFEKIKFSKSQKILLNSTVLFNSTYKKSIFQKGKCILFLLEEGYDYDFNLVFWFETKYSLGHYYFHKAGLREYLTWFMNPGGLRLLKGYHRYEIVPTLQKQALIRVLSPLLDPEWDLEIEVKEQQVWVRVLHALDYKTVPKMLEKAQHLLT